MGTGLEYKENIESKESSFSFRDSISQDIHSIDMINKPNAD